MIPDKIYIRHYWMPGELDDEWRLKPIEDEQCEEYIRKGALLEWAMDVKAKTGWYEIEVAMDDLIEKLNSM